MVQSIGIDQWGERGPSIHSSADASMLRLVLVQWLMLMVDRGHLSITAVAPLPLTGRAGWQHEPKWAASGSGASESRHALSCDVGTKKAE